MSLNLTATLAVTEVQGDAERLGSATLVVTVVDDRPYITNKLVDYTVDWGDGSELYTSDKTASPKGPDTLIHTYRQGRYTLTVTARNSKSPRPDFTVKSLSVYLAGDTPPTFTADPVIYGPILPRDAGFPNKLEWEFNSSRDNLLLASSAKQLLQTVVGERLMNPLYGTNIHALLFDPQDSTAEGALYQELVRSFSENEPRLSVVRSEFFRESKKITVNVTLQSQLDKRQFALTTTFQTT